MRINTQKGTPDIDSLRGPGLEVGEDGGAIKNIRKYTATVDLASIADADGGGANVTCTGVAIGDAVIGVTPTTDPGDDFVLLGTVTAADTVRVTAINHSGGAVDHPSETFTIWVLQAQ